MNWVDYVLLALVVVSGIRGLRLGAASQVLSFGGFCLGLFLGALVVPALVGSVKGTARSLIVMGVVFGAAFVLGGVGPAPRGPLFERAATRAPRCRGFRRRRGRRRGRHAGCRLAGGQFRGQQPLHDARRRRGPVTHPARHGQDPAPGAVGLFPGRVLPDIPGLSRRLRRPATGGGPPRLAAHQSRRARRRGQGRAVDRADRGGGVWRHPGRIGIRRRAGTGGHQRPRRRRCVRGPCVLDGIGRHAATAVLFDPRLDLAVLRVPGLSDPALPIDTSIVDRGTSGVVLGYPEGGPFDYRPAAVAASFLATGLDIYGKTQTLREVYEIDAVVQPGNSGGPLISSGDAARHIPDGTVIGVVFARSTINPDVGYALAMAAVQADVSRVGPSSGPVGTGGCVSD